MENIRLLLQIYYRTASAMSDILDRGSWAFAALAILVVSLGFFATVNSKLQTSYAVPQLYDFYDPAFADAEEFTPEMEASYRNAEADYEKALATRPQIPLIGDYFFRFFSFDAYFFTPLLALSLFYVPLAILLMSIFGGAGNFGVVLGRDYTALSTCTLLAWAAAHLPFAIAGIILFSVPVGPLVYFSFWILSSLLFGVFMIYALRTVFGANYGTAVLIVAVNWMSITFGMYAFWIISPWVFSPFILIFAIFYFGGFMRGQFTGFGDAFRQRQNFKRVLQNATINPNDADAHVQLGLIYLQRRQENKSRDHFEKAFEIDSEEIDANYELGKLARKNGEFQKALDHFSVVVGQNDKHALSEIWREIGATYLEANMPAEATDALERFVSRRAYDPEGLYYLGKLHKAQNHSDKAHETFTRAVEAAKNSPDFRRREVRQWGKLARRERG